MQAKNGFAIPFKARGRLIGCAIALVALSTMAFAAPAGAMGKPPPSAYLALGDSLSFGFSSHVFAENLPFESPLAFEEGFDNFFANKARQNSAVLGTNTKGLVITNDGCPGETAASFNGETPPCAYHNTAAEENGIPGYHFPLHHEYGGCSISLACPQPQLFDAVENLFFDKEVLKVPVDAVTLDIGANDLLKEKAECESKFAEKGWETAQECIVGEVPRTFNEIGERTGRIVGTIRAKEGGNYSGPIIIVGLYNPFGQTVLGSGPLTIAFNEKVEEAIVGAFGGAPGNMYFANPYPTFNFHNTKGNPNREEERICLVTNMCSEGKISPHGDIHPTKLGYQEMARVIFAQEKKAGEEGKV